MLLGIFVISVLVLNLILYFDDAAERRRKTTPPEPGSRPASNSSEDVFALAQAVELHGRGAAVEQAQEKCAESSLAAPKK